MMETKIQWVALFLMNWPKCGWVRDPETVGSEMRTIMRRNVPDNEELCSVIRWLAGPENRQNDAPSMRELIRAVYVRRKESRTQDIEGGEDQWCQQCRNTGWIVVPCKKYPNGASMPCLCYRGQAIGAKVLQGDQLEIQRKCALAAGYHIPTAAEINRRPFDVIKSTRPADRWDVCCDMGRNEDEIRKFLEYAASLYGGVVKPVFPGIGVPMLGVGV